MARPWGLRRPAQRRAFFEGLGVEAAGRAVRLFSEALGFLGLTSEIVTLFSQWSVRGGPHARESGKLDRFQMGGPTWRPQGAILPSTVTNP